MAGLTAVASVGAGVSQGRLQSPGQTARLTEQEQSTGEVKSAALQLLQAAVGVSEPTGHDLDVLA